MKPEALITRTRGGPTSIYFPHTKRTVEVPAGITVSLQGAAFGSSILYKVASVFLHSRTVRTVGVIFSKEGNRSFKVTSDVQDGVVYWNIYNSRAGEVVAAGFLDFSSDSNGYRLYAAGAYAKPKFRGLGLYRKLLRMIKREYKLPIFSDKKLSPEAVLVYMSTGTYAAIHGRYRVNPRGTLPAQFTKNVKPALFLAYSEEGMGDRIV